MTCERVTIHYVDFCDNAYRYELSRVERIMSCAKAGVTNFDNDAFREWYRSWAASHDLFLHEGGAINARSIARMWFTVEEVH